MQAGRRFVIWFLVAALVPTFVVGALVIAMDPYQNFHATDRYPANMRYLAPGMARHQHADTVIIGDSMTQNFIGSVASRVLGRRVLNLSVPGSTNYTQGKLARLAIEDGGARNVIWGIRYRTSMGAVDRTRLGKDFPRYLYDRNPFNDYRYVFNQSVVVMSWWMLRDPDVGRTDPNLFNTWFLAPKNAPGRAKVLAGFKPSKGVSQEVPRGLRAEVMSESFDRNVLRVVKDHPEVHFTFFIPPHTGILYANMMRHKPAQFAEVLAFMRHVFDACLAQPNVTLHYFDHLPAITHNLDNYKDTSHYSVDISNVMLRAFLRGQAVVTPDNKDALLERFVRLTRALDPDSLTPASPDPVTSN